MSLITDEGRSLWVLLTIHRTAIELTHQLQPSRKNKWHAVPLLTCASQWMLVDERASRQWQLWEPWKAATCLVLESFRCVVSAFGSESLVFEPRSFRRRWFFACLGRAQVALS